MKALQYDIPGGLNVPTILALIRDPEKIPDHLIYPLFARPCPIKPRHGFVDSRVVNSSDELKTVVIETLAADPEGEVMVMKPIDADWSAVITPTLMTIGPSNDGATAGKDTLSIPAQFRMLSPFLLDKAEIGKDEDPYLEIVHAKNGSTHATQLRAGPKVDGGVNYIPADVEVKKVIYTYGEDDESYSLLEWEKIMNGAEPGTVVYHPGGSQTDHFTVHARLNKIPVILDSNRMAPLVGSILKKETVDEGEFSPSAVLAGLVMGERMPLVLDSNSIHSLQSFVALMLVALYNSPSLKGEHGRWLGIATSLMLRLGSAALSGEARHAKGSSKMKDRNTVYSHVLPFSLSRHRARLNRLINVLRYGFEGGGVGGEKWAKCGASLIPLFNSVSELARNPTPDGVATMAKALNVAVDQAHNNGWWLNKFADQELFKYIQCGKHSYILKSVPAMFKTKEVILSPEEIVAKAGRYAGWEPVTFRPVRMNKAVLASLPNLPGLTFELSTRLLRTPKRFNVPAKALQEAIIPLLGQFYIIPGKHGLAVEMRKGDERVKVWEEKSLL